MKIHKSLLLLLIFSLLLAGCNASNHVDMEHLLFDAWYEKDVFTAVSSDEFISKDKQFTAKVEFDDLDHSGLFLLSIYANSEKTQLIIGRSCRGISVQWFSTKQGEVLAITDYIDTHHTQSFVIQPVLKENKQVSYIILYSDPKSFPEYFLASGTSAPTHIYSNIKDISSDGMMKLSLEVLFSESYLMIKSEFALFQ